MFRDRMKIKSEKLFRIKNGPNINMQKMNADHETIRGKNTFTFRLFTSLIQLTLHLMRERFRSASLRFKIASLVVALLACTSFALCIITVQIMNESLLNEIIKRGETVGKNLATLPDRTFYPKTNQAWIILFYRQSLQIATWSI